MTPAGTKSMVIIFQKMRSMEAIEIHAIYLVKLTRVTTGAVIIRRFDDKEKAEDYYFNRIDRVANLPLDLKFKVEFQTQLL